jgi:gag-polypeptide of LTR copia-type
VKMSDTSSFKVGFLVGSNYFSWRDDMEALLVTKDLWDAEEESSAHRKDENGTAKSAKARAHMLMCTAPKLRGLIPKGSVKQAWQALENFGKQRASERKIELHRQLASCTQKSSEKVSEFIRRAEGLRRELVEGCQIDVSDVLMMGILLNRVGNGSKLLQKRCGVRRICR